MTTMLADTVMESERKEKIAGVLKGIVHTLTGIAPEHVNMQAKYIEAGIDSLLLIQATQAIQERLDVRLSVVQLLEELDTLDAVANYLDQVLPPDAALGGAEAAADAAQETAAPAQPTVSYEAAASPPPPPLPAQPPPPPPVASFAPPPERVAPPTREAQRPEPLYSVPVAQAVPQAMMPQAVTQASGGNGFDEAGAPASVLEQIMAQQLQVMAQQLELLRVTPPAPAAPKSPAPSATHDMQVVTAPPAPRAQPASAPAAAPQTSAATPPATPHSTRNVKPEVYNPYQPIDKSAGGLTPHQQKHLAALIEEYTARTRESKRLTQAYRPYLADSRVSAGFRLPWKEMVYQLVAQRSQGSRFWDVDGNEYVDITMGFGLHLFGHSPEFVTEALARQLKLGIELGPQSRLAGEVARLICELSGLERVNMCNSGTEAVMGALRIARTVTRRNKIATFAGAYHGWSDFTLARPTNVGGERRSVPVAPGVLPLAVEDTLVLDWDNPQSLAVLEERGHELACVLVEPVQSRRPDIQPQAFLKELRRITEKTGAALIFDEMVTGFRIHPGGAQAWFGIQADLAIYGKVIGSGLPMGVVAGKSAFMDAFDGGMWDYGDASYPRAEKTLFAGAFFKHPLTMAVAHAVLTRLRDNGVELLGELNKRTARLVAELDAYFEQEGVPIRAVNYGSLFRLLTGREFKYVDIFYYHLVANGVFVWEGRNCFLSVAHTDEDVDFIIRAVKKSIEQTRAGGFLPEGPPDAPTEGPPAPRTRAEHSAPPQDARPPAAPDNGAAGASAQVANLQAPAPAARDARGSAVAVPPPTFAAARVSDNAAAKDAPARPVNTSIQFSLYYFGSYQAEFDQNKYDLLFKGAQFADEHDFTAVWLPERHFYAYGGFSPNPSVLAAALARETRRVQIRAGSVALPLHHPVRVAEEWSIVDNLSRGRVGISFASGWHANDFVFAPDAYANRRQVMDDGIEVVRKLWRGEAIQLRDGQNELVSLSLSPMPMQRELPFWLTGASNGTVLKAGQLGGGVLTNLQDQTLDELAEKITLYHRTLAEHGHDPATARVTLLLHTFLADDVETALGQARPALQNYLRASIGLQARQQHKQGPKVDLAKVADEDVEYITARHFERFRRTGTLIGTPDSCAPIVDKLIEIGVTEIGCLIDFGVPTADVLASLPRLNALRERYQRRPGEAAQTTTVLTVASAEPVSDIAYTLPLTDAQKQFWILTQLGDHVSAAYNESVTLTLHGELNVAALGAAVRTLVERHDALRSSFSPRGDVQEVHTAMACDVPLVAFDHLPEAERARASEAWFKAEMSRAFDMARGPLFRAALARLGAQEHALLLTSHHIIADGHSWGVMLDELAALYSANCQHRPAELPPPRPLRDQSRPQARTVERGELERAENYWLQKFSDTFPILELPVDRPRPPLPTYRNEQCYRTIDAALGNRLKSLCQQERTTLFVALLSAYNLLLHQLTGQGDVVVGINAADPVSVRQRDAVGYRISALALRSKLVGDPTVRAYLAAEKKEVLEAYEHQNFSAANLFKQVSLRRDPRRASFVSASVSLNHSDGTTADFFGLEARLSAASTSAPSLDLYLDITEARGEMQLKCNYNADIFEPQTVERWLAHFEALVTSIVADPDQRISQLPQFAATAPVPASPQPAPVVFAADRMAGQDSNLTKYQWLFWAGQKLNPDTALFVHICMVQIAQRIEHEHLQRAFQLVLDSSDALRTVIEEVDGVPYQRVRAPFAYEIERLDFSNEADPQARLDEWALARGRVPFDLSERLFNVALVKLGAEEYAWFINIHHIIADAWSIILLERHTFDLYRQSLAGQLPERYELPQFSAYLAHEQAVQQTPRYRQAEAYWREKLSEPIEPLSFYGKPALKQTTKVERVTRELGYERTQKLKARAADKELFMVSADATLFNIFATVWTAYLYRLTGSRRIALGAPFHNRATKAFLETIGMFTRILPLRVEVAEGETFATLQKKVVSEFYRTLRHHEYPVSNPLNRPAYDVEFNYINTALPVVEGVPTTVRWLHPGHANESLAFQVHDIGQTGSLMLNFDFNCDVFDAPARAQAIEHFLQVVDAFIADRARPLDTVSLLTPAERQRVLSDFNQTARSFPLDQPCAQLFEAQVARTPDAAAVRFEGQSLTYAQLNTHANRVARRLRAAGVGPGVVVPLLARRGAELLTAMLGVFKAGGAYLPLDPFYPPQRLAQLLRQSQSSIMLVTAEFADEQAPWRSSLPWEERPQVLVIDELINVETADENLSPAATAQDLSYVIYTSGSTGVPKGAMLEHRGMVNHLFAKITDLKLTATDIVAQTASQAFDISVWQFFAALLVGGQVRVVGDEDARDAVRLLALLEREAVTIFETVPSLLRAMLAELETRGAGGRPRLSKLRWLLVTGEALPPDLCQRWLALYPNVPLLNAYGPTECSDDVTHYVIAEAPAADATAIPIGQPLANMRAYILDRQLTLVPPGVPGELCVGGVGVGRGYFDDPARTAEVFVPDPFGDSPGARLYRTGDLARHRADGNIEFLGRLDQQVKIRGYRIELGEIEAALKQHPEVAEAVVVARAEESGEKRLVAYLVARQEQPTVGDLRGFLQARLPEHMTPAAFVMLAALPLTPNGKVDVKALPAPDPVRPELQVAYVAPRTPAEEILADIFKQLLNVERVGVNDSFFELGGDSILSIQVVSRANQAGLRITPMLLFQHQTVAALAAAASTAEGVEAEQGLVTGAFPLSPVQHWFFEQELHDPHHFNQALMLEVRQPLNAAVMQKAVEQLLLQHDALRMRFTEAGGAWSAHGTAAEGAAGAFAFFDLSALPEAEQRLALEAQAARLQASLNLTEGPVMRAALFDLGAERAGRLLLVIHHLVVDGVSWRVLLEDLQIAYEQLSRGTAAQLPPKTTSYKQWAERLREYAQTAEVRAEAAYWLAAPRTQIPQLPPDHPQGDNALTSVRSLTQLLTAAETQTLLRETLGALRVQINDLLLAALARACANWTGERALLVNLESHGREELFGDLDLSRTVGWFTTMTPVLLEVDETAAFVDEVLSVKEQLGRLPRRGIGYGLLRYLHDDAQTRAQLRALPAPQISFNYLGQLDQALPESPVFKLAAESAGPSRSRAGRSLYLLDITGAVVRGQLRFDWSYSEGLFRRETIERLAADFAAALRSLLTPAAAPRRDELNVAAGADFNWSATEVADITAALEKLEQ